MITILILYHALLISDLPHYVFILASQFAGTVYNPISFSYYQLDSMLKWVDILANVPALRVKFLPHGLAVSESVDVDALLFLKVADLCQSLLK